MHDVLEDTGVTRQEMQVRFGANIANLVEGVTKIGQYKLSVPTPMPTTTNTVEDRVHRQRQAETYRKLLLATAEDMRVILIKLADRLHNMEDAGVPFQREVPTRLKRDVGDLCTHRTPIGDLAYHEPSRRLGVQAYLSSRIPKNCRTPESETCRARSLL